MSRREDIYDDDQVEIMLDTFHDRRRAYAFQTTPLGVQWDAIWTEASRDEINGNFDTSFDTVWDSRGKVTSRGYRGLDGDSLQEPALSRRRNSRSGESFCIAASLARTKIRSGRRFRCKVEGRLGQAATLYGLEGISPGRNIELIPYGLMRGFRALDTRDSHQSLFSERRRCRASPAWTRSSSSMITSSST